MHRKFAAFDIDGTLIRWQMYHAVIDELIKHGDFNKDDFAAVKAARFVWKERAHDNAFKDYENEMIRAFDASIKNVSQANFLKAVESAFETHKNQSYRYTRNLIQKLKEENYLLFAISGSDTNVVKLLAQHYGFDDFGGSVYETIDGAFTGKFTILTHEKKTQHLDVLLKKHGTTFAGSIGVGDSEGDIPMLDAVEHAIAFNPTSKLFEHARQKSWKVVIERKDMIYELNPTKDSYELTNPDR